jgi:hypothetical protein
VGSSSDLVSAENWIFGLSLRRTRGPSHASYDDHCADRYKAMKTDRRKTRRFALSLPVEACGENPLNPQPFQGRTRNISVNGIYFVCDKPCMPGQTLRIIMKLSVNRLSGTDSIFLTLRCRVRRVDEMFLNGLKQFGCAVALDE